VDELGIIFDHRGTKAQRIFHMMLFSLPQGIFSSCAILLMSLSLGGFSASAQETITVAVASSLYPMMQEQTAAFEKQHHVSIRLVPGSTGRLYNQIIQGAPFDLFIAADKERPALLASQGKAISQRNVAQGYLGVMIGNQFVVDPERLINPSIRHIAIANPDVAPFGAASKTVLQKQGIWSELQPKFVYAQNAMQAAMMVNKGLVDAALIPISSEQPFMAIIPYIGVLLTSKQLANSFLQDIEQRFSNTIQSGGEVQGECCPQQRKQPGVLASSPLYIVGTAEAVLPK